MKRYFYVMIGLFLVTALMLSAFSVAQAAKKPIEFRWVSLMEIRTLDGAGMHGNATWSIAPNLYDTLVYPDVEKGYIPWIAKSWKISDDLLRYTFYLKKGIPFHDGTEVTAEDVVFTTDRLLTLKEATIVTYFKRFLEPGTTKALDKYTVEFNLTRKAPEFMVSLFMLKIMNKKVILKNKADGNYGEYGDYGVRYLVEHDAGSGPFMAVEHRPGNFFKMKRFEEYPFVQWKPTSFDTVKITNIPEAVTTVTKLKVGELDMGEWTLPAKSLKELQKNPNFNVSEEYALGYWTCHMNTSQPPLDDPYVRKAVSHAWNRDVITRKILAGGRPGAGPIPDQLRRGCTDLPVYEYDLEKAKALLKKSKYSAEELKKYPMTMASGVSERFTRIYLSHYSDLKKLGLNPVIETVTWPAACKRQQKPETAFAFSLQTGGAKVPHPTEYLNYYTKSYWGNAYPPGGMYYHNPKVEEALKKAADTADPEEQNKYYCIAQRQIAEDAPAIWSHNDFRLIPLARYVKGYKYPVGAEYFQFRFERYYMDTEDPLFRKNHGW